LLYFIQNLHINKDSDFKHTIIYGPPGVGKTIVAKLIGLMYSKLGILKNNIFKKVTRCDLVAGYLGQTSIKVNKIIQDCLGGVIFIDEVYSLGNKNGDGNTDNFSKECIDTLCEALSFHRDDLMVIVAGYKEEIEECFFSVNKGLSSRFIWRFSIEGYNSNELMRIFLKKISDNDWSLSVNLNHDVGKWFDDKKKTFKNYGRDMELLFSYTKICHGKRIFGESINQRKLVTINDLENGYKLFVKNGTEQKEISYGLYV
jgi:SpoVK/Ycf46/Vps4 family AAA+-type ATPase